MTHDNDPLAGTMMARLNKKLGDDIAEVIKATFDASGFAWQSDEVRAEIARQLRLQDQERLPVDRLTIAALIAAVVTATFDAFGFAYDPEEVRAEVARQLQRRQAISRSPAGAI